MSRRIEAGAAGSEAGAGRAWGIDQFAAASQMSKARAASRSWMPRLKSTPHELIWSVSRLASGFCRFTTTARRSSPGATRCGRLSCAVKMCWKICNSHSGRLMRSGKPYPSAGASKRAVCAVPSYKMVSPVMVIDYSGVPRWSGKIEVD